MPEFHIDRPPQSIKDAEHDIAADNLVNVDWRVQAQGCEQRYTETGDIDYELMRVMALHRAREQQQLFAAANAIRNSLGI